MLIWFNEKKKMELGLQNMYVGTEKKGSTRKRELRQHSRQITHTWTRKLNQYKMLNIMHDKAWKLFDLTLYHYLKEKFSQLQTMIVQENLNSKQTALIYKKKFKIMQHQNKCGIRMGFKNTTWKRGTIDMYC